MYMHILTVYLETSLQQCSNDNLVRAHMCTSLNINSKYSTCDKIVSAV